MKYDCCESCYFYYNDPGVCDFCDDGDQYEPEEGDDDVYEKLMALCKQPIIPIKPLPAEAEVDEPEEALLAA
jgi:hypothetical protein